MATECTGYVLYRALVFKTVLILWMVNNAEIVQCESQVKIGIKFCEDDVLGCSCSNYYFNCADVCARAVIH